MTSASDYSSDSENDAPIAKRKKSTGAKSDNDDFSFKNVLRPPRSTTYTAQALYGTPVSIYLAFRNNYNIKIQTRSLKV